MQISNLITPDRITNLKIQINSYSTGHQRFEDEMILEMIEDYYKDYKEDGPEFISAFDMIHDELFSEPDGYEFGFREVNLFILRYFR